MDELIQTAENKQKNSALSFEDFRREVLDDYKLAYLSRQISLLARKEVLNGKAKFGIFGDGKEVVQIAYAKYFKNGDWRSGYYRDQTFMFATGMASPFEFFSQIYGDTNIEHNPGNGGRNFNNHYSTQSLNEDGSWKSIVDQKNSTSDISPTAAQTPRLLGLAYASKLYRQLDELKDASKLFSRNGNEVAFGMIGDSSTSEGHFFEVMNAAAVMQIPLAMAVWDDGYGISVPTEVQTVKGSISEALEGFRKRRNSNGILIYKGKGWDYPGLCKMFEEGISRCRNEHVPVLFHIEELTQPQGHSTSGSHERYKSKERLQWEADYDCLKKMREWILECDLIKEDELKSLEDETSTEAYSIRDKAWAAYSNPIKKEREELIQILRKKSCFCNNDKVDKLNFITTTLKNIPHPIRKDVISAARKATRNICPDCPSRDVILRNLTTWINRKLVENHDRYSDCLYVENEYSSLHVPVISPVVNDQCSLVNGREIVRDNFIEVFKKDPRVITFGEDTGKLGDVNQCLEGLQEMFGELRISDTGIRETSIIGTGIGMALRGLKPIAEIQYLDYLIYTLQTLSDDLATLHWRTKGRQVAPVIIRTRGHRFEGVWHSGSPMSMIINAIRGIYVCVPRNLTQAAGMYNTLLQSNDSAVVIEPLNGYRLKERRPDNMGEFTVPIGIPEILKEGEDITIVTYGSCVRLAEMAAEQLKELNIDAEVVDVQTLVPFDIHHIITESIKKTNRVLFLDEDVPGGASAYMMQQVVEMQKAYQYLDGAPHTLAAAEHRPAYSSDGDYASKPGIDDIIKKVYYIMHESNPQKYPLFIL